MHGVAAGEDWQMAAQIAMHPLSVVRVTFGWHLNLKSRSILVAFNYIRPEK